MSVPPSTPPTSSNRDTTTPNGWSSSDLRVRAREAAGWALLDKWVTRALTTVIFIILARLLSPQEFGLVALALVVRNFLAIFIDQGFSEAIIQAPDLKRSYTNTAFWTAITTGVTLTLITILVAPFVAEELLRDGSVTPLLRVLAISLTLTALSSTQSALLQRDLRFRELAIRRVVAQLVAGVIAVVAALLGAGAWSLVLQALLQGAIGAAILWRYSTWRPALEFQRSQFRSLAAFGVSMIGIDLLNVVQQQADNLLVGRWLGAVALGIYAVAFRFYFVIVDITMSSMASVALSTFSRVQQDLAATRRVFLSATRLTSLVALPVFAGMFIVASELIPVLVGDKWEGAVPVLRALCPSGLILCLTYLDRSLIVALGRPRTAFVVELFGVAIRVVGYVIGVQYGVVGVAVGLSVASIVYWPVRLIVLRRLTEVSLVKYIRQLGPAVMSSAVLIAAVLLVRSAMPAGLGDAALLAIQVCAGAAAFVLALAVIDRASLLELLSMGRSVLAGTRFRGGAA